MITLTPYQMMEAIDAAESKVGELRDRYLRKSGWNHTSSTPGCYWMWVKEIEGRTYMLDSSFADRMQRELDYREMNKDHAQVLDAEGTYCVVCGSIPGEPEDPHKQPSGDKHA